MEVLSCLDRETTFAFHSPVFLSLFLLKQAQSSINNVGWSFGGKGEDVINWRYGFQAFNNISK
jgi:hypothetical protein